MKKLVLLTLTVAIMSLSFENTPLKVGDNVPDFKAVDDQGASWTLSENLRVNYLVIYFYPAAFTGGCTTQACNYRDLNKELAMMNASVVGISGDEVKNLTMFKKEHNLNFTLLSDQNGDIAKMFGVTVNQGGTVDKEIGGQKFQLVRGVSTARWTFIVDGNGKLIYRDNNVNAATDGQAVLEFIKLHEQRKTCR